MNKNIIIMVVVILAVLGIGIFLASKSPATPSAGTPDSGIQGAADITRPTSHMTGSINAKVQFVEFGDYQCPACGAAYAPIKQIVDQYQNDPNFNFVFRNFPLPMHPNAPEAAEAAEAAGAQGKYWQMHDLLYTNQNTWSGTVDPTSYFVQYAQQLGLDTKTFQSDVTSAKYINVITQDQKDGDALGIDGTPTLYLNGQQIGQIDYTTLTNEIAADVKAADAASAKSSK